MFSDYETRVCECVLHQLCCNNCSKRICAPVTQICVLVNPILCLQWYKKYLRLQMYCYTFVTLEYTCKINIRPQIYCDFSVRIQILQLQVLKPFATIIPSYCLVRVFALSFVRKSFEITPQQWLPISLID